MDTTKIESRVYKPVAKVGLMGEYKFRPQHLQSHLIDFDETWN